MALHASGVRTSLWNNNAKSVFFLTLLPATILGMVCASVYAFYSDDIAYGNYQGFIDTCTSAILFTTIIIAIWFAIAYFFSGKIMMRMTNAIRVERKEYPELYNLTENLAIAAGIPMPQLYMMDSQALNAFATGLKINDAIICVTKGLVEKLDKQELEAVLAHEMSHILHRDIRMLTIATLFVGIIAFAAEVMFRMRWMRSDDARKGVPAFLIVMAVAVIGYFVAVMSKFAISRKREYMADAGSVVLTKDRDAMIRALEKISGQSEIEDAPSDVKYMLFDNSEAYLGLFSTHPPIEKRIEALRKY